MSEHTPEEVRRVYSYRMANELTTLATLLHHLTERFQAFGEDPAEDEDLIERMPAITSSMSITLDQISDWLSGGMEEPQELKGPEWVKEVLAS